MSFLRDTYRSAGATAVFAIGRFVGMALIARALGPDDFGILVVAMLCIDLLGQASLFGLHGIIGRYSVIVRDADRPRWRRIQIIWVMCSTLFLLVVSPMLGAFYLDLEGTHLVLFAVWAVVTIVRLTADATMQGRFRFDLRFQANLAGAAVLVLGGMFIVQPGEIHTAFVVLLLATLAHLLPLLRPNRREGESAMADADRPGLPERSTIVAYALNLWLIGLCVTLVWSRGEMLAVKDFLDPESLAYYGAAMTLMGLIWRTLEMLNGALTVHVTKRMGNEVERERITATAARLSLAIASVGALGLAFLGQEFVLVTFGDAFAPAGEILALLAPGGAALGALPALVITDLLSNGRFNRIVLMVSSVVLLSLAWGLVQGLGVDGLAVARDLVLVGTVSAAALWLLRRRIGRLGITLLIEIALAVGIVAAASAITLLIEPPLAVRAGLFVLAAYAFLVRATGAWHPVGMARSALAMLRGL